MMYARWLSSTFVIITIVMQVRNFNRYRVERARKHSESIVYLNSDVCADPITRAQLGTFNLCEKAEHIRNESPTEAAMYERSISTQVRRLSRQPRRLLAWVLRKRL